MIDWRALNKAARQLNDPQVKDQYAIGYAWIRAYEAAKENVVIIERRTLELPQELFNEAAKPPYDRHFKSSSFDKMLFAALEKAGLEPKSPVDVAALGQPFTGVMVNVAVKQTPSEVTR